jgi:hypothetical protein
VPWFETQSFSLTLALAAVFFSLTAISGGIRHRWENRNEPAPGLAAARVASILGISMVAFLGVALLGLPAIEEELSSGIPDSVTAALVLPHVSAALVAILGVFLGIAWGRRIFPLRRRLHYTLFFTAALGLHWLYFHWNVLGFRY